MEVTCDSCRKDLIISPTTVGRWIRCPNCRHLVHVLPPSTVPVIVTWSILFIVIVVGGTTALAIYVNPLLAAGYCLAFVLLSSAILGWLSRRHRRRQDVFLFKPIECDHDSARRVRSMSKLTDIPISAVSLFDVLYNLGRVDPMFLRGVDHLHHAREFSSLHDITAYLKNTIIGDDVTTARWDRLIHKYKGYTGEEVYFEQWGEAGLDLTVPDSGTQEGYDAIVDGVPVNVKITENPDYIRQTLRDNPDVTVATNAEMAAHFPGDPRVIIDESITESGIADATEASLDGINDLGGLIDWIPIITVATATIRNSAGVCEGRKSTLDAFEHTAVESIGVGAGGLTGAKLGVLAGLMLSPVTGGTSAIIIPAASSVIGTMIGVASGRGVAQWFKERRLRPMQKDMSAHASVLRGLFIKNVRWLASLATQPIKKMSEHLNTQAINQQSWLGRVLFPSAFSRFCQMASRRSRSEISAWNRFYRNLLAKTTEKDADPIVGGMLVYAQGTAILQGHPKLLEVCHKMDDLHKRVEKEKQRIR